MNNRLSQLFKQKTKNVLSIFFTAGFPSVNDTGVIARALEKAGADLIEIGIPFSDPIADGPVIQQSSKQALDQGMNLKLLLEQVKQLRSEVTLPVVLMGYINPILQYGIGNFCRDARTAGEFLPKRFDVIAQRFVRSGLSVGLGVGRFVLEAGDRECRRAWLCDIWLFLLGLSGFWLGRGRFCRAWLFCFWLSRALFFGAWLIRVGGHRDARDRGGKAQATHQAA